jgi:hypothetical protein
MNSSGLIPIVTVEIDVGTEISIFPSIVLLLLTLEVKKFIVGVPIKPATKMFSGLL